VAIRFGLLFSDHWFCLKTYFLKISKVVRRNGDFSYGRKLEEKIGLEQWYGMDRCCFECRYGDHLPSGTQHWIFATDPSCYRPPCYRPCYRPLATDPATDPLLQTLLQTPLATDPLAVIRPSRECTPSQKF
jgi:hypothetical protein